MFKVLIALAGASVLLLSGCGGGTAMKAEAPPAAKAEAKADQKPALSDDAKQALAKAEADVKTAKAKKVLWTTASDALDKAKDAAEKGDSNAVIKNAKAASGFVKLNLDQSEYPLTK